MSALAPAVDLDISSLKLKGDEVANALVDGDIERTIDGASTLNLTVHDPKRTLLQAGVFGEQIDVTLDGLAWRLVKVVKQADEFMLTFEDRQVAMLRTHKQPRKASRASVTRAQFALSLVREVSPPIAFFCPELNVKQPVAGVSDKRKVAKALPYQFRRGAADGSVEDSWTCLQRLASEVNWRCFCSAGTVSFVSDADLMKLPPSYRLSEGSLAVSAIDFEIDNGKTISNATITARAARWSAGPGSVIELSGLGPADGLWLVSDVRRGIYDAEATITLKRPTKALPEPAGTATASSGSSKAKTKLGKNASSAAAACYQEALVIDAHRYPYVWGGGHGAAGVPSGGPPVGYDCSGSTVAVLAAGGLGFKDGGATAVSGTIASSWGDPGEGADITVWANDIHVFIVFHTASGDEHFGTGLWGKSWGGAGFNTTMHPTAGFTPRHWPGT